MNKENSVKSEVLKGCSLGYECRIVDFKELEIREATEENATQITGYAAVFNEPSELIWGFREKIAPGAFDDVLKDDVRATFNHDSNYILGRSTRETLTLEQDKKGLRVEIDPPETAWVNDLLISMRRGDIDQMSFQFRVAEDGEEWLVSDEGEWLRTITKFSELADVSVVAFPAYPQTTAEVRAKFEAIQTAKTDFEKEHPEASLRVLDRRKNLKLMRMRMKMG